MRILDRIKAVLLMFALCFTTVNAMVATDVQGTVYEDAVQKLIALGIFDFQEAGNFYPQKGMTRVEFTVATLRLCGYRDDLVIGAFSGNSPFTDVRSDIWYAPYVEYAVQRGMINGVNREEFEPDTVIKSEQAVKILVSVMGYSYFAEVNGGYPSGYMLVASQLKLLQGLGRGELTRGEAALLIDRALDAESLEILQINVASNGYTYQKRSLSEARLKIFKARGIVTRNRLTALSESVGTQRDQIVINNNYKYNVGETRAEDLLGYHVEFYYTSDDSYGAEGENTILYISKTNRNSEVTIDSRAILAVDANFIEYERDGRVLKATLNPNFDVVQNNKAIVSFSASMLKPALGEVRLISNNGGQSYNVVMIRSYRNMLVAGKLNMMLYDKFDHNFVVDLEKFSNNYRISNIKGETVGIENVAIGNVLSIFVSQDEKYIEIIQSTEKTTVELEDIDQTDHGMSITAGEMTYKIDESYLKYLNDNDIRLTPGSNVSLYFDYAYNVVWHQISAATDALAAFLVDAAISKSVDPIVQLKVFTKDSKHLVLDVADAVEIDGVRLKQSADIMSKLSQNGQVKNIVLIYKVNPDGEVIYIDTPAENAAQRENESSLFKAYTGYTYSNGAFVGATELTYKNNSRSFGFRLLANDGIPIFAVPSKDIAGADENFFSLKSLSYFNNDGRYYLESYQFDRESFFSDILVIYEQTASGRSINNESNIAVVKKISTVQREGVEVEKITALREGSEVSLIASSDDVFRNVKAHSMSGYVYRRMQVGDVFRYESQPDGTVGNVQMIMGTLGERVTDGSAVDPFEKDFACSVESANNLYAQARFVYRNAYSKAQGAVRVTAKEPSLIAEDEKYELEVHRASSYRIFVVTRRRDGDIVVRTGNIDDIICYDVSGDEYSKIVIHSRYGEPRSIVVYRDERS